MHTRTQKISLALALAVLLLVAGIWWGGHPSDLPSALRSALTANNHLSAVDQALADIEQSYFRRLPASGLENSAITGAVATLGDPYATYQTPAEYRHFGKAPAPSSFSGVGIEVLVVARGLLVQDVIAGSPAARGRVKPGDVIVAGNGKSFRGRSAGYSTAVIRGKTGTPVTLTIQRGTRRLTVKLVRAVVNAPPPQLLTARLAAVHGVRVAVIALATFDVSGIHLEVAAKLRQLLRAGAQAVVLDLRDNGGGLVTEAQAVASLFIRRGAIVTTRGRAQPTVTLYASGHPLAPTQPMAVLVNGDTASAAEIVTGALQVDHRAIVVGTHTYGKGVYQEVLPLRNGGAIDITVGEYFLPNGKNLGDGGLRRGAGIVPNVIVKAPAGPHGDPALNAALRLVAAKAR